MSRSKRKVFFNRHSGSCSAHGILEKPSYDTGTLMLRRQSYVLSGKEYASAVRDEASGLSLIHIYTARLKPDTADAP